MEKITIITHIPTSIINQALRSTLIGENICNVVDIVDINQIEQLYRSANNGFSGYILLLVNGQTEQMLKDIVDMLNHSFSRTFIFMMLRELSYDEVKAYCRLCNKLAIIDQSTTATELRSYIEELYFKDFVICKHIQGTLLTSMVRDAQQQQRLSNTQKSIVDLYEKGYSIQQTATELGLSTNTVAAYRSRIIKMFRMKSMAEVVFKLKKSI